MKMCRLIFLFAARRVSVQASDNPVEDTDAVGLRQLQQFRLEDFYWCSHGRSLDSTPIACHRLFFGGRFSPFDGMQPACGGALRHQREPAAGATLPHQHPTGAGQKNACRSAAPLRCCQAQDALTRRHHAPRAVAAGVHAAPGSKGRPKCALWAPAPRPWLHLIRFRRVLAPNAKLRARWWCRTRPKRLSATQRLQQLSQAARTAGRPPSAGPGCSSGVCNRHGALPELRCELKIIAAILKSAVIERILTHQGLQARAPPRAPARACQLAQAARSWLNGPRPIGSTPQAEGPVAPGTL